MSTAATWLSRRRELVMVAILAAVAATLIIGSATMTILGSESPGPAFFPMIVGVFLAVVTVALGIDVIRKPEAPAQPETQRTHVAQDLLHDVAFMRPGEQIIGPDGSVGKAGPTASIPVTGTTDTPAQTPAAATAVGGAASNRSDHRSVVIVLAALLGFIALLQVAGWVIAAAALYWVIAYTTGSKSPVMDIFVALFISSVIQLIFGTLLGLNLPAGLIGAL